MRTEVSRAGTYRHPSYEMQAPALQIYEIQGYFNGNLPKLPFRKEFYYKRLKFFY